MTADEWFRRCASSGLSVGVCPQQCRSAYVNSARLFGQRVGDRQSLEPAMAQRELLGSAWCACLTPPDPDADYHAAEDRDGHRSRPARDAASSGGSAYSRVVLATWGFAAGKGYEVVDLCQAAPEVERQGTVALAARGSGRWAGLIDRTIIHCSGGRRIASIGARIWTDRDQFLGRTEPFTGEPHDLASRIRIQRTALVVGPLRFPSLCRAFCEYVLLAMYYTAK